MGIDVRKGLKKKGGRTGPKSKDIYLSLLVKLYRFLSRRTDAKFNKIILKRLCMSNINRAPLSVAGLTTAMSKKGREKKIAVCVGTITEDRRCARRIQLRDNRGRMAG